MKIRNSYLTPCLAALVGLILAPGTKAADDADAPKTQAAQKADSDASAAGQAMQPDEMPSHSSHEMSTEATPSESAPTKANKASGILGMDVRNQDDEHLGHIKDLVIDWKTAQVSYAVISTAPKALLGISEKLLAVPLNALSVSFDQKHLLLNADKSEVAAAMGFKSDDWPSVSNPIWGAQPFWQSDTEKPDQPATPTDTNSTPGMTPKTDSDTDQGMKPDRDTPATPDMAPDSKPKKDPESAPEKDDDVKPDEDPNSHPGASAIGE